MTFVMDTNVFISGVFFSGPPYQILKAWQSKVYITVKLEEPVCDDPDDDKFLACALASRSKIIISGDKHLLKVSGYEGIEIVKPRVFVDRYLD